MIQSATITPETAFPTAHTGQREAVLQQRFQFQDEDDQLTEQLLYKELIDAKITARKTTIAQVAERIGVSRQVLARCIRGKNLLTDERRDALFEILGIDHVRAKICVVFLRRVDVYDEYSSSMLSEAIKAFYCQLEACRTGIRLEIKPPVIHEAMKRGMTMLMQHQRKILSTDDLSLD